MKHLITTAFFVASVTLASEGGTITGKIQARANPGADNAAAGGKYDSRKFKFVERIDYDAMRDFVVYIEGPVETSLTPSNIPVQVVTKKKVAQKGAAFSPHVLPVVVGTTVEFPNEDEIFHNVFSISDTKEFDLGLYKDPEVKRVTFNKQGRVDTFCSIHSKMNCIVLVLENPFFATADKRGRYSIPNVPPGTYQLKAWHERLPSQRKTIVVDEDGEVRVDFTLGLGSPPPE